MYRFLILTMFCLILAASRSFAQVPQNISVPFPVKFSPGKAGSTLEGACGNTAGTFQLGAFTGQSNDTTFGPNDTLIVLCANDQIFIDHNGDFTLNGDPVPATTPGIGWAFYSCPPTVTGDTLYQILADPCIWPGATNGIWVAKDMANGDIQFDNNGTLISNATFNPTPGQPLLVYFAPITIDDFATVGYENTLPPPAPAGPCVNVNTSAAFKVLYLNPITHSSLSVKECLGQFIIKGGYPEWDKTAVYTIKITHKTIPGAEAIIHLPPLQSTNGAAVEFSVPQSGTYVVTVEDGKSCGYSFEFNANACNASDKVNFELPELIAPPNTTICMPIIADNFSLVGASFSVNWDPLVVNYLNIQNLHPNIAGFIDNSNFNVFQALSGKIGTILFDDVVLGNTMAIPNGDTLFDVCFTAIGPLGSCTGVYVTSDPTQIKIEEPGGIPTSIHVDTGQICINFLPLDFTAEAVDTSCANSLAEVEVKLNISGGKPTYDLTIEDLTTGSITLITLPTASPTTVALPNGSHSVCIVDENGFGTKVCDTITINLPDLGINLDVSNGPSCFGKKDGEAIANVTLGGSNVSNPALPEYSFTWSGPGVLPNPLGASQIGVGVGQYMVTVTQVSTGCTEVASGTMGGPSDFNKIITKVQPSCTGICDGSVTLDLSGATPFAAGGYGYQAFFLAPGSTNETLLGSGTGDPINFPNLCAGDYRIVITDANGCSVSEEFPLANQRSLTAEFTITNTKCFGDSTGTISVEVIESTPSATSNYQFFWVPQFTQTDNGKISTLTNVPGVSFNVVAVDITTGCSVAADTSVGKAKFLSVIGLSATELSCPAPMGGAFTVNGSGGTSNGPNGYTYLWDTGSTSKSINGLGEGTYCVTVTDLNGCTADTCKTFVLPSKPLINALNATPVVCGADGCVEVVAPTATTFAWTFLDGTPVPNGNTAKVCNLMGDTFIVKITDAGLCENQDTISLTPVAPLVLSDTTFKMPSCFGKTDGSISIGVAGGNPPVCNTCYTWNVTPAQNSAILTNVGAGSYTVTITDSKGCKLESTLVLTQPPAIVANTSAIVKANCSNSCDGQATIAGAYQDGSAGTFSYQWEDGSITPVRTDLCPGFTQFTIRDNNNCFIVDSLEIQAPPEVGYADLKIDSVSCAGKADGEISVSGTGGNGGPYTYQWSNSQTTNPATGLDATIQYSVTISDSKMCTTVLTGLEVPAPVPILIAVDPSGTNDPDCFGFSTGAIAVTITGGNDGVWTYSWEDAAGDVVASTKDLNKEHPSGQYALTATDSKGCSGTFQYTLVDPPAVVGSFIPIPPLACDGDVADFMIDTIYGGAGGEYSYSIDFGAPLDPDFELELTGGEHVVTYFDRNNCPLSDTFEIFEPKPIEVKFDSIAVEIELGESIVLRPEVNANALIDTFFWAPLESILPPTDTLNPTVRPFQSITYTLSVVDENGCTGSGSIVVNVDPNRNIYVPNAFKPGNEEGKNTHLNVFWGNGVEIINYFQVYDRWGSLMYDRQNFLSNNDDYSDGWDGRYKGKYVNPGVYIFVVEAKFLDGRTLLYRGDVTVVR